jgi:hypothetical protein
MNQAPKTIDYLELGKLLYPQHKKAFADFFQLYRNDFPAFEEEYEELLEDFDFKDLTPLQLIYLFGENNGLVAYLDWRGEENKGELEEFIQEQLNDKEISWESTQALRETEPSEEDGSGEYVLKLFQKADEDLKRIGMRLVFINLDFDGYAFKAIPETTFKQLNNSAPKKFVGPDALTT